MRDQRDVRSGETKKGGKKEAYSSHQFFLKSFDEMNKIFSTVPDALKNTVHIADMVDDFFKLDVPHLLPPARLPDDNEEFNLFWKSKLPYHKKNEAYLAFLALKGLRLLGHGNDKKYLARLDSEIKQIWYMGVTDYFLIQREMVEFM